jgi:threonine synthase
MVEGSDNKDFLLNLEAIRQTKGWAANATDKSMRHFSRLIREKKVWKYLPLQPPGLLL